MDKQEQEAADIKAVSIPVFCQACGGTTHLVTYGGVQWHECDDVDGCGWMILA